MWTFRVAHQHKLLLVCTRRWHKPQSASYRAEDRSITSAPKRRRKVSTPSAAPHNSAVCAGRQLGERSAGSPGLQAGAQRSGGTGRVSAELRKLRLEDFPAERERELRQESERTSGAEDSEVLFGVSPCLLALTQGRRKAFQLFVKDEEASQRTAVLTVCAEARRRGVPVQRVTRRDLDRMCSGRVHQGVCLQASPLTYLTEESAPSRKDRRPPLWLVLEKIQDPMNLGAILRSAYFLGVERVACGLRGSCPLSPVVSKASSGVMEAVGVYGYENLHHMVEGKVAQGWQAVGTVGSDPGASHIPVTRCSDFRMSGATLLLLGSEGEGLSRQLLSVCQTLLTVPAGRQLPPGVDSLNVSVAAGILLHALLSSR